MKLKLKPKTVKPQASQPERKERVDAIGAAKRFNFFLPDELKSEMDDVIAEGKKVGVKTSFSLILRNGATKEIDWLREQIEKAENGEYHAKKRK